jgi:uncharacterized protein with PIN domain
VDESTGPYVVARWLRQEGHDVFSVYDEARGMDDDTIIEQRILITNHKGFGEKVYRQRRPHTGVVLLRLEDERPRAKIATLRRLLLRHSDRLPGSYVVATEQRVRFAKT